MLLLRQHQQSQAQCHPLSTRGAAAAVVVVTTIQQHLHLLGIINQHPNTPPTTPPPTTTPNNHNNDVEQRTPPPPATSKMPPPSGRQFAKRIHYQRDKEFIPIESLERSSIVPWHPFLGTEILRMGTHRSSIVAILFDNDVVLGFCHPLPRLISKETYSSCHLFVPGCWRNDS
jgi:hypothetical protein